MRTEFFHCNIVLIHSWCLNWCLKYRSMIKMAIRKKEVERKIGTQTKIALLKAWLKAEEKIIEKLIEVVHFLLGELDGIYSQNENLLPFNVNDRELLFKLIGEYMCMCANMSEKLVTIQLGSDIWGI
ncbi:MAG: hypothetical protein ACFFCD_09650 [Promethearchaeota archaeon]